MQQANKDVEQAREILRYFMQHPQASDDLEGIARWRLLQEQVCRQVEQVQRALELLVQLDLLQRQDTPAAGKRYCLNPDKVSESQRFANNGNGNARVRIS